MNKIEEKLKEEIRKLQIENERSKGNLVEKKVVQTMLEEVVQSMGEVFKGFPKTQAAEIAKIFNMSDKVDAIEKMLAANMMASLNKFVKKIKDLEENQYA